MIFVGFFVGIIIMYAYQEHVVRKLTRKYQKRERQLMEALAEIALGNVESFRVDLPKSKKDNKGNILSPIQKIPDGS